MTTPNHLPEVSVVRLFDVPLQFRPSVTCHITAWIWTVELQKQHSILIRLFVLKPKTQFLVRVRRIIRCVALKWLLCIFGKNHDRLLSLARQEISHIR